MTSAKTYEHGDLISRGDAESIYAERDARKNDLSKTTAMDRARKAIGRAKLPSPDGGASFLVEEFFGWAKELDLKLPAGAAWVGEFADTPWRERFSGFPATIRMSFVVELQGRAEWDQRLIRGVAAPECSAPAEWHAALAAANSQWADDQRRIAALEAELAKLRPIAEAKSSLREKRQEAGKKGGRPSSTDNSPKASTT